MGIRKRSGVPARDLTDTTVDWLYVKEFIGLRHGERWYLCVCTKNDCGKTREVSQYALIRKQKRQCVSCAVMSKGRNEMVTGGLTLRKLTKQQKVVYWAIMRGRKNTVESRDEALGILMRATELGELDKELEFWTAPCTPGAFLSSSLAQAITYGSGRG